MQRVFKREGFIIYKLIPCILITIFAFMCLYGSFVYADTGYQSSLSISDTIINLPDYIIENCPYLFCINCGNNRDGALFFSSVPMYLRISNNGSNITLCSDDLGSYYLYARDIDASQFSTILNSLPSSFKSFKNSCSYVVEDYAPYSHFSFTCRNYEDFLSLSVTNYNIYDEDDNLIFNNISQDYTDISNLPNSYYLLTGSRSINNTDTPIHIYCNEFLQDYSYILAYYSYKEYYGYYLDLFFSNEPLFISHGDGNSSDDSFPYIPTLYSVYSSNNSSFYHLELLKDEFDNNTTTFNLTSFELSSYILYENNSIVSDRERFQPDRIVYHNYPITVNEDNSTNYLTNYDNNGVLYRRNESNSYTPVSITDDSDTFNPKTNVTNDIMGSIGNINTSFDLSDENVSNFDSSDTGNLIKDAFSNLTNIFSFTNDLLSAFFKICNFFINTEPSPTLTISYKMWDFDGINSTSYNQFPNHLTSLFGNGFYVKNNFNGIEGAHGSFSTHTITLIDLSWYAPYKDTIDLIVAGFMYLAFVWHLVNNAPNIIHGIPSTKDEITTVNDHLFNIDKSHSTRI